MIKTLCLLILLSFCSSYTFAQEIDNLSLARERVEELSQEMRAYFDRVEGDDNTQKARVILESDIEALFSYLEEIENLYNTKTQDIQRTMTAYVADLEKMVAHADAKCADQLRAEITPLHQQISELEQKNYKLEASFPLALNEERLKCEKKIEGYKAQLQEQQRVLFEHMKEKK